MQFSIVTPEGVVYEDDIQKVTIPTTAGEITVLADHAPMVSVLKAGEMFVHKNDNVVALSISTGMIEIRPTGEVIVLADTAERAERIDVERAEEARKRAEALLKEASNMADVDFARIQAQIEKEMARISVGKKYKKLK